VGKLTLEKPYGDKSWSLQFHGDIATTKRIRQKVKEELHGNGLFAEVHGFLQGGVRDTDDWIMVEFRTDDIEKIIRVCEKFAKLVGHKLEIK
jgi:hypothetical protein